MTTSALHRELHVDLSTPVSFDLLCKLVDKRVREQSDLDFKQKFYHSKNDKDKDELVKDVCAMANSGGGWIICGIAEEEGAAATVVGITQKILDEAQVHQLIEKRTDPPVNIEIHTCQSEDQSTTLTAIQVPKSPHMPHLMRVSSNDSSNTFKVPVRKGPGTAWLDERALRALYRKSFDFQKRDSAQRDERFEQLKEHAGDKFPGVSLVLLLTPDIPLNDKPSKDQLRELIERLDLGKYSINREVFFLHNMNGIQVRDRRFTASQNVNRYCAFIEVDFNGSVAVAIQLATNEPGLDVKARELYTFLPDEASQNLVESALTEAFNFATQIEQKLNPASDSKLQLSILPHAGDPIVIRQNHGGWAGSFLLPKENSVPIKHFRTISAVVTASPAPEQEHEVLTDLVLDVLNQAGIEKAHTLKSLPD